MNTRSFWTKLPDPDGISMTDYGFLDQADLFNYQMNGIANSVILGDFHETCKTYTKQVDSSTDFKFINVGEVIAGSSICNILNNHIEANDIDIYVHSIDDAIKLLDINNVTHDLKGKLVDLTECKVCFTVVWRGIKINLIWGVKYKDAEDLISRFDIRACSMAFDPNSSIFTVLAGALEDSINMDIHFNLNPRSISVARLLKYISKGFKIDKYQRVVFAELIRTGHHFNDLELTTGYGGTL